LNLQEEEREKGRKRTKLFEDGPSGKADSILLESRQVTQ